MLVSGVATAEEAEPAQAADEADGAADSASPAEVSDEEPTAGDTDEGEEAEASSPAASAPPTTSVLRAAPVPTSAAAGGITLLFTSDLDGALIDSPCGESGADPLLPLVGAARSSIAARGGAEPVLIDAGDALFPSALVGMLGAEGTSTVMRTIAEAGYDALIAGDATLTAPAGALSPLLGAANEAELPFVLTNAGCAEDSEASECERGVVGLARRSVLIQRGSTNIGVVAVVPADLNASIPLNTRSGGELTAPAEAASAEIAALRERGANLIILVSNLDDERSAPRRTLELLTALGDEAAPDVVIAASTAQIVARMHAPADGPPILTAAPRALTEVHLVQSGEGWDVDSLAEASLDAADEELSAAVTQWNQGFCERHDRALSGGELTAELDREAFAQLALRSMREQANAEIAIINRRAIVDTGLFPLQGQLTAARVQRVLPVRSELRVARVRGSDLAALLNAAFDSERAWLQGVVRDGDIMVNGREIRSDGRYRVVTTTFVASGGDEILGDDLPEFQPVAAAGEAEALPDRVVYWLDSQRGSEPYDPSSQLDLHRRSLWYSSLTLDASLAYTRIRNDAVNGDGERLYDQAQISRNGLTDIRFAAEARGGLSVRGHAWDNLLRLRYGRQWLGQWSEGDITRETYTESESDDQIFFRTSYDMDYLRDVVLDGAWYAPSVFLELSLESEFVNETQGDNEEANDREHFLELTGLLGLKLKPLSWLNFSAAAGIRSVVLEPDPYPVPGLNLRLEIPRQRFSTLPVYVSFLVDYFVGWPVAIPESGLNAPAADSAIHKLSAELRLDVTIYGPLALTGTVRGFLYDEEHDDFEDPVALAFDTTLGLSVALGGHRQSF